MEITQANVTHTYIAMDEQNHIHYIVIHRHNLETIIIEVWTTKA